ncbi:Platelet-derived growth factor receptor alpha [Orchesella cincta]|uniref:Platelet-derived growth factor receptor alpha n=1 Tax=Orchesella cincta TaxID=48709 RepID=A0A1D2M3C5_ORCCI|nr:Platelet-derived growth factor receptor alpha [Orchesella cincta]
MYKTPTIKSDAVGATTYWWIVVLVVLLIFFVVASAATLVVCKKICKKCCLHNTVVKEFYEGSSVVSDLNLLLGSGAFGAVYEGIVVTSNCETKVAVKTTMPSSPSTAMTGLLSEIKVLTYLGNHDNIVNIIGAYTKAIKKGNVYLFLELCENGSLDQYLREKISYSNSPENGNIHSNVEDSTVHLRGSICTSIEYSDLADSNYDTGRVVEQIETPQVKVEPVKMKPDTAQLRRWCYEISNGMAFLASKNAIYPTRDLHGLRHLAINLDKACVYKSQFLMSMECIR